MDYIFGGEHELVFQSIYCKNVFEIVSIRFYLVQAIGEHFYVSMATHTYC
jgi:hypothetical protein